MSDTPEDIKDLQIRKIAARSPVDRLRMASSMFDCGKRLVIAGLLRDNPTLNHSQLRAQTFLRLYGDIFTQEEIKEMGQHIPDMELDRDSSAPERP